LEADDSKSECSFLGLTPVASKRSARGRRTKGRTNCDGRSSMASFEDSNTENEPEQRTTSKSAGGSRTKVARKVRVARSTRKNVSFQDAHGSDPKSSTKRTLKERQQQAELRPVAEEKSSQQSLIGTSDSEFVTPADKKKRRLYSMASQVSEVFTPPTDSEYVESPHAAVTRQLRSRRAKRL